jgi:ankyrin repeat protein
MKHLLLTTIAAVVLVGCGPSMSIHKAASLGNIEAVKQHLASGADVNATADMTLKVVLESCHISVTECVSLDLLKKYAGKENTQGQMNNILSNLG